MARLVDFNNLHRNDHIKANISYFDTREIIRIFN